MQTINLSNGDTLQFPDEMSDEAIQAAIHKEYGVPSVSTPEQELTTSQAMDILRKATGDDVSRNLTYGALNTLGKAGQSAAQLLYRGGEGKPLPANAGFSKGQTPVSLSQLQAAQPRSDVPSVNMEEYFSPIASPNKTMVGEGMKFAGSLIPSLAAGGETIPGQIAADVGSTGLTADENQQNSFGFPTGRTSAMFENALFSILGLGALKGAPKAINMLRPGKTANEITSSLANIPVGKQTSGDWETGFEFKKPEIPNLRQNSESLSTDIKNSYDTHTAVVKEKMNPVTQKYGESLDIYPMQNPSGIHAYREMPKFKLKGSGANDLYKDFKEKPNLNNAHQLQQKIGEQKRMLQKGPQDSATRKQIRNLDSAYKELNSKIDSRLQEVDPQAAQQWKEGREYHRVNVEPYRSNPKIKSIINNEKTNPKNIHQPFEYPGGKLDKKSKQMVKDDANKIISDLPPESKNKILFSKIGGSSSNKDPNKLLSNLEKAKDKGSDTYFNKDLDNQMNTLRKQIKVQNVINPINWISHMMTNAIRK